MSMFSGLFHNKKTARFFSQKKRTVSAILSEMYYHISIYDITAHCQTMTKKRKNYGYIVKKNSLTKLTNCDNISIRDKSIYA